MPRFLPYDETQAWNTHEAFYARRGVKAWTHGDIPHLATNNRALARQLGAQLLAHVADTRVEGPVGVLEIGGGLGTFAAELLGALADDLGPAGRELHERVRYVFSDFVESTLQAAAAGPELAPHVAAGRILPALYDARKPDELRLLAGGEPPPILFVIANYLCCVLPTHPLRKNEGRWWRLLVAEGTDLATVEEGAPVYQWAPVRLESFLTDARHVRAAEMTLAGMDTGTLNLPHGFFAFVDRATSGAAPFHPRALVGVTDFGAGSHRELVDFSGEPKRYGSTLNHQVSFPLFDDFAAEAGLTLLRTAGADLALHTALWTRGELGAGVRAAFAERFVAGNAAQDLLDYLYSARMYIFEKELPQALRYLLRAEALDPRNAEIQLLIGSAMAAMGRVEEGLERLLAGRPLDVWQRWDYDYRLGEAYLALGDHRAAIASLRSSLARAEDSASLLALGEAHDAAGEEEAAYRCFARAAELETTEFGGARLRLAAFKESQWRRFVKKAGSTSSSTP